MKAVKTITIILLISALAACASTGSREPPIYENDFSTDEGKMVYFGGEHAETADGVLYLKGSDKNAAWAGITTRYGRSTGTEFRIKFGDPVFAHINFLNQEGVNTRLLLHVMEDWVSVHSFLNGEDLMQDGFKVKLLPNRWYDFSFTMENSQITMFIDGEKAGAAAVDSRLPSDGWLTFECHGEYRVDDIKIYKLPGDAVERTTAENSGRFTTVKQEGLRELLLNWEEAIRSKDAERFEDLLWPDVTFEFHDRRGRRTDLNGAEAVRRFRLDYFDGLGAPEDYRLPAEPEYNEQHGESNVSLGFLFKSLGVTDWIHTEQRGGTWQIQHLELHLPIPGSWVTNRWQALADENNDGFLQPEETKILYGMADSFFAEPHAADTATDRMFDSNQDGYLDADEIISTAEAFFGNGFKWFRLFSPGWADKQLDLDDDEAVSDQELDEILDFMTGSGLQGGSELNRGHLLGTAVTIPFPDAVFQPVLRQVTNYIDELADRNEDSRIDEDEQKIILISLTHYHDVDNYLERALDTNREGRVDHHDVLLAMQASAGGKRTLEAEGDPPYRVITPRDKHLDGNGDALVDAAEISAVVELFTENKTGGISAELRGLADWNDDGRFTWDDLEHAAALLVYPHPVNPKEPLDVSSDINDDGFIDPSELGITGGVSNKGEVPTLADRIRLVRIKSDLPSAETAAVSSQESSAESQAGAGEESGFQSEYYQRLGKIQDRKLAVISLDTQTASVDNETSAGIVVFVENAFVNVGKVRVVERNNIEKIMQEFEFQSTALIDENTAIEIGKLSGADIIVIGSINRVGGMFYLNIKLIDVKTAEIIGSNIAKAKDETEFLDMCNQAVYMLF